MFIDSLKLRVLCSYLAQYPKCSALSPRWVIQSTVVKPNFSAIQPELYLNTFDLTIFGGFTMFP